VEATYIISDLHLYILYYTLFIINKYFFNPRIEILQNVSCKMLLEPSLHSAVSRNDYIVYIVLKLTIYTILEDVGLYN